MRHEITDDRDRTYSRWHRRFDGEYRFIDVDHVEYCPYCNEPLALIETAIDNGQTHKCSTVTTILARKMGLPSFVVLYLPVGYDDIHTFRVKKTNPSEDVFYELKPEEYLDLLTRLHVKHNVICSKYSNEKRILNESFTENEAKRKPKTPTDITEWF